MKISFFAKKFLGVLCTSYDSSGRVRVIRINFALRMLSSAYANSLGLLSVRKFKLKTLMRKKARRNR